jgi:Xaa-Pro aminopeptidase
MDLAPSTLIAARHERLREAVAAAGCDALVVTRPAHVFYLSNFSGSAGALVLTPTDLLLVVDFRYVTDAETLLASPFAPPGTTLVRVEGSYDETLAKALQASGARAAGFESEDVSVARHAWLREHVPAAIALQPTRGLVERLRVVKDVHEIAVLRRAARALAALVPGILEQVRPGRRETEVAGAIEAAMRSSAFSRPAFDTIVASGPNGARPHAAAGDRILARGDLVVLDFGGVMDGYCVDMTRTVALGPPDAGMRQVFDAVRRAQQAAIDAVRPGVPAAEIDHAARSVLEAAGLGEAFGHATGHGLGLEVHEEPRIARLRAGEAGTLDAGPAAPIVPGMVFTVEPGAYLPGAGGVRIEDDVLVTPAGCDVLTEAPRDLVEL